MEYTKQQLQAWAFDRHGYGRVNGYSENGFAGSWYLHSLWDVDKLPKRLIYVWVS